MRYLISLLLAVSAIVSTFAQPIIQVTPYTADFLKSANAATARTKLGVSGLAIATQVGTTNVLIAGSLSVSNIVIHMNGLNTNDPNIGIGAGTLNVATNTSSIAIGNNTLPVLTSGHSDIAIGKNTGASLTSGYDNTMVGVTVMGSATSARSDVSIGKRSLDGVTTGSNIVAVGVLAGSGNTTGNGNSYLGYSAGGVTTGSGNLVLGSEASVASTTADGQLSIQNIIFGTGNTGTGTTVSTGYVGIGIAAPTAKLDVAGSIAVSGTYTDASNYERGFLAADPAGFTIGQQSAGTGTWRPFNIGTGGTNGQVIVSTNGVLSVAKAFTVGLNATAVATTYSFPNVVQGIKASTVNSDENGVFIGRVDATNPLGLNIGTRGGASSAVRQVFLQGTEVGIAANDIMLNPGGGNVGIGVASGTATVALLEVNGKGVFDGNLALYSGGTSNTFSVASGDLTITPSGGDVILPAAVKLTVGGGTPIAKYLSATATLNFGSILAAASADLTITVTGAAVGDAVHLGLPAAPDTSTVFNGFVSAADTVTVRCFNVGTLSVDPASATYRAVVVGF